MTTTSRAVDPVATALARAEPAGGGQIAAGVTLALVQVLVAGAVVTSGFALGGTGAGVATLVATGSALTLDFAWWMRAGHGLAWRVAGISLLARTDDAPLGFGRLVPMPPTWVAATRGRRHPVDVRLDPVVLSDPDPIRGPRQPRIADVSAPASAARRAAPAVEPAPSAGEDQRGPAPVPKADATGLPVLPPGMQLADAEASPRSHGGPVRVTVDGQSRHVLTGTAIVGRRPVAEADGQSTIEVTDLTRTLSKNHLRLSVESDSTLVATDLGSTNGSAIVGPDGARTDLLPHAPAPLGLDDSVTLGDHRLTFSQGGSA